MPLALAARELGAGPPLVVLHGLFGAGANWTGIARKLAERRRVFLVDLRNHGASPWDAKMDYPAMAADVGEFLAAHGLPRAAILGHSMGGKAAMVLTLTAPASVERLIVADIAPVARPPELAAYAEAMRALDLTRIERRGAADLALKPSIADDSVRAFLLQNLVSGPEGLRWRLNLDAILAGMAAIAGFPDLAPDKVYPGPTLLVRGALSAHVRDRDIAPMRRRFPALRVATVADAGHWLHAEQPAAFLAAVLPFLDEPAA